MLRRQQLVILSIVAFSPLVVAEQGGRPTERPHAERARSPEGPAHQPVAARPESHNSGVQRPYQLPEQPNFQRAMTPAATNAPSGFGTIQSPGFGIPDSGVSPVSSYGIAPVSHYGVTPVSSYGVTPVSSYGVQVAPHYSITPAPTIGVPPVASPWPSQGASVRLPDSAQPQMPEEILPDPNEPSAMPAGARLVPPPAPTGK